MKGLELLNEAKQKALDAGWDKQSVEEKYNFVIARAKEYAEHLGLNYEDIIEKWESKRNYSFVNYYQDANQPKIDNVRVFENIEDFRKSIKNMGFRCPYCMGISSDPQECDSGQMVRRIAFDKRSKLETCNWKSYGLFRTMGKGVDIFLKDDFTITEIFMPIAWEENDENKTENKM